MLEPLPVAASLRWLWPELVLIIGGILILLLERSRDVSWLTARRFAPITALIALAASFAVPFEPAALAGDFFRSDAPTLLVIRVILATTLASLLLGGRSELIYVSLAGCLAARASDALSALMALQFLALALVFLAVRSGASRGAASRFLARSAGRGAVAAVGFACLIGMTAEASFVPIGISLAHQTTFSGLLAGAALLPVLVIAEGAVGTPSFDALFTDSSPPQQSGGRPAEVPSVTRSAVATIIPAGLLLLLLRTTGSGLASQVGSTVDAVITTIPWRLVVGLIALGAMFKGTLDALRARHTAEVVAGLLLAQAGWLLSGAAQGSIVGARAVLVALVTGFFGAFVFRPAAASVVTGDQRTDLAVITARLAGLAALLSLAGSPGTIGFIGRWDLFESARTGPAWWLAAVGSILWGLSILAAIRWYLGSTSNAARCEVNWSGRLLALFLLGFSLFGNSLRLLVMDAFPFP
ncbi:MAG: proton-conducting transporter membrane subunit [Candidatus Eisenbacteria bacterium]|nr:proton-conducting transporter membrane subunit [Candidatus Eisenbacteria bacterium]